jgi:RNA polymerase sigma-70 factor (ECF subfamily)
MTQEQTTKETLDSNLWVDRYGDIMFRFAMARVKDPVVAEEIVQITLVAALQAQKSFAGRSSEKSWLFGIMKHKILDYFRQLKNHRTYELTPEDTEIPYEDTYDPSGHWVTPPKDWETDPIKAVENKQLVKDLAACLEGLPEKYRNIFTLKEIEGMESGEICKEFDIQPTNLWVILHRARNQLRKCLEGKNWKD